MMKTPEIAAEITLQPVHLMGVDAAILYSDILMVPDAMGLGLNFKEEVGPVFDWLVAGADDVARLNDRDVPSRTRYVYDTIALIKKALPDDFPLLGFAGAPFTVATYMMGAKGADDCMRIKRMAFQAPEVLSALLAKITRATIEYLVEQVKAGVDAVQLFDTWAGVLAPTEYAHWALPSVQQIFQALRPLGVPTILYIKGGTPFLEQMAESGADVVSLDWRVNIPEARRRTQGKVALQGNLDPAMLYAPIPDIERATRNMLHANAGTPGYIANLGHGILPDIPVDHARAFIETVKQTLND